MRINSASSSKMAIKGPFSILVSRGIFLLVIVSAYLICSSASTDVNFGGYGYGPSPPPAASGVVPILALPNLKSRMTDIDSIHPTKAKLSPGGGIPPSPVKSDDSESGKKENAVATTTEKPKVEYQSVWGSFAKKKKARVDKSELPL